MLMEKYIINAPSTERTFFNKAWPLGYDPIFLL